MPYIASFVQVSLWIFHAQFIKYTFDQILRLYTKFIPSSDNIKDTATAETSRFKNNGSFKTRDSPSDYTE